MRARELGIVIGQGEPGPYDSITDVPGVRVGHTTLIEGEGPLEVGRGPVRTGVTVVVPHPEVGRALVFAGWHRLNGNGELTGLQWVRESGRLDSPVALTNTHSVGVVRDALVAAAAAGRDPGEAWWDLPVVGETWDGVLNDIDGQHVRAEHVLAALAAAAAGPVPEGNVGGGTGMICHGFKGGIGTASRVVRLPGEAFTVGVLVQANHGRRERLQVNGVPVGAEIPPSEVPLPMPPASPWRWPDREGVGSIIVVVGTDAPLLPHQCDRLAQRAGLGVARTGGAGEHTSGDLFLAFSTGNAGGARSGDSPDPGRAERGSPQLGGPDPSPPPVTLPVRALSDDYITPLFYAVIEATEEAILNTLLSAETMTGRDGHTAHALPTDRLLEVMARYGRGPGGRSGAPE
jgi:D-aminopeptidase